MQGVLHFKGVCWGASFRDSLLGRSRIEGLGWRIWGSKDSGLGFREVLSGLGYPKP